ncbi:DNA polymerase delta catalytic subunit-like, partial [Macrobrachium nipponense]|uniref:DNA polymerase delta catalytic subunit-like n=1 Tax=Macrobrachium nipponense TaxID=159736 RepID=UPI0030C8D13F
MFGVDVSGNSVCCHIHGFYPYFYMNYPEDKLLLLNNIDSFKKLINEKLAQKLYFLKNITDFIISITIVNKRTIYGYNSHNEGLKRFLKITIALPKLIHEVKNILELELKGENEDEERKNEFYEANIDFILRFMIDVNLSGCSWIEIPSQSCIFRDSNNEKESTCQIEIDVLWTNIMPHDPVETKWASIGPLTILSFDIECANRRGIFPTPDNDPIIQIGNVIAKHDKLEMKKVIFVLGKNCDPIEDAKIFLFHSEQEMLKAWSRFVQKVVDPDIITGYNINNFDFPYLIGRAKHLNIDDQFYLSRIKNVKSFITSWGFESKQVGKIVNKCINVEGRCIMDVLSVIKREYKLRSYSLNAVSQYFLNEQKDDIHHTEISELHRTSAQTRRKLAVYCLKDALLPLKLIDKLMLSINYIEMARVTGVPLTFILTRGQQIKIMSQLLRNCALENFIVPSCEGGLKGCMGYQGATVIEPAKGFYNSPITTLDFCSLYPTIIMAHNLCYTTLLLTNNDKTILASTDNYTKTPTNNYFVKPHIRKGLLPRILENLLMARKKAKDELKRETDPLRKKVLDGRQLALKISANSVYGLFTGAQMSGKLPCIEISQSVTAFGREMIMFTKNKIEEKYVNAKVIYGDTDSVMINFGVDTIQEAIVLGQEAAAFVTNFFMTPIKLEFEKVYFPYLLINKKRYAGLYYTRPENFDRIDCKGIETIRRDNCRFTAELISEVLNIILIQRDTEKAITLVKNTISELLHDRIDISKLIITKELTKTKKEYKAKQAHVELAYKMKLRESSTAPQLGDRVPYVIIKLDNNEKKNTPLYQKAESPEYVVKHNLQLDYNYYLKNQIRNPLLRIFEPILGSNVEKILLSGDHMISKTGTVLNILSKPRIMCIKCNAKYIQSNNKTLICIHCRQKKKMDQKTICSFLK